MPLARRWSDTLGETVEKTPDAWNQSGFYRVTDADGRQIGTLAFHPEVPELSHPAVYVGETIERDDSARVWHCPPGTVLLDSDGDAVQRYDCAEPNKWATTYGTVDIQPDDVCLPATVVYVP